MFEPLNFLYNLAHSYGREMRSDEKKIYRNFGLNKLTHLPLPIPYGQYCRESSMEKQCIPSAILKPIKPTLYISDNNSCYSYLRNSRYFVIFISAQTFS